MTRAIQQDNVGGWRESLVAEFAVAATIAAEVSVKTKCYSTLTVCSVRMLKVESCVKLNHSTVTSATVVKTVALSQRWVVAVWQVAVAS